MPTQTKENYLKAIYMLDQRSRDISLTDLSKEMDVSAPTVNNMVKKLQDNGWVIYKKYKPLQLTDLGRKTAAAIVRKHRLSEMFLSQQMGFGWEEVHDIAEDMEHIKSEKFFDRMDELLGHPSVDPHGSPIPDKSGKETISNYVTLNQISPGCKAIFRSISDDSREILDYLNTKELTLNTTIEVNRKESFDNSVIVSYYGHNEEMLSHMVCERILVEAIN